MPSKSLKEQNREAKLQFLYEDEHLFVLNKSAHIHSVKLPQKDNISLADFLLTLEPALTSVGKTPHDAGLLQRLDFETSGCLLGAKSSSIATKMRELLFSSQIEKSYLVVLQGQVTDDFEVSAWLGSRHRGSKKVTVIEKKHKQPERFLDSHSSFHYLASNKDQDISLYRVYALQARRHQVRAHAAHAGHPLLGDSLYGSKRQIPGVRESEPVFLLHAHTLSFQHPLEDKKLEIQAPVPEAFLRLFKHFEFN